MSVARLLKADLARAWPDAGALRLLWYVAIDSGTQATAIIRLQQFLESANLGPLAKIVRRVNYLLNGIDWVEGARAGAGLVIPHPVGVIVGHRTRIGDDVTIMQGVTLGQKYTSQHGDPSNPTIEDGVSLGANSIILGDIKVGRRAVVGAGSVVTSPVEGGDVVGGVPARVLGKVAGQ